MEFFIQSNSRLIEEVLASAGGLVNLADQPVAHAHQMFPLAIVALEAHAFRFFRLAGKLSGIPGAGGRGEPGRGPKMLTQLEEKRLCLAFDRASRRNSPLLFRLSRRSRCWGYCEVMLQIFSRSFQVSPSRTLIDAQ